MASPPRPCRHDQVDRDRRDMILDRRTLLVQLAAAMLAPRGARAATVTDGAGRSVPVPARVERVFPAGPPAAIFLYTLAPELLLDRKSTRLNSSHLGISYAVFC